MTEKRKLKCDTCGKKARHKRTIGWIDFSASVHIYKEDVKTQWFKKKSGLFIDKDFCSISCLNAYLSRPNMRLDLADTAFDLQKRQTKKKELL